MPANHTEIEKKLWSSADKLRVNSHLKSSEYSVPILGLIYLRFAKQRDRVFTSSLPYLEQLHEVN